MHVVDATMFFCARSGGVKRYLLAKREWLARRRPHIRHSLIAPAPQPRRLGAICCDGLSLPLPDGYCFPLDVASWRRALLDLEPDVIEAGDPYAPGWAAQQVRSRFGVPAIAFYHSDMPTLLEQRFGGWCAPLARSYLRSLYAKFDLVLAPSATMRAQLADMQIHNAAVQPLGVDIDVFRPDAGRLQLRERLDLPQSTRLLVYAGRFGREKNIDVLMEMSGLLGLGYHLLLIGGARRKRLNDQAIVLPYQGNTQQLARLLASCDVFVHAGDRETYGLVVAEAMACGLPVAAVARGALPELVDERVGALAPQVTGAAMAHAVRSIFERGRQELSAAARERITASYSWDRAFTQLSARYEALTDRTRAPALALASA